MRTTIEHGPLYTACGYRMAHRKWKETKLHPSMLPGPAVPGCSLFSFHFLWAILCPQAVHLTTLPHAHSCAVAISITSSPTKSQIPERWFSRFFTFSFFISTVGVTLNSPERTLLTVTASSPSCLSLNFALEPVAAGVTTRMCSVPRKAEWMHTTLS